MPLQWIKESIPVLSRDIIFRSRGRPRRGREKQLWPLLPSSMFGFMIPFAPCLLSPTYLSQIPEKIKQNRINRRHCSCSPPTHFVRSRCQVRKECLVLRFINSVTNLFTQDLVLPATSSAEPSEQERPHNFAQYVSVIANRST